MPFACEEIFFVPFVSLWFKHLSISVPPRCLLGAGAPFLLVDPTSALPPIADGDERARHGYT
jgi:hypothetical protein